MKCIGILISFLICCVLSFAQKQNNFWAFGNKLGLDFNTVGGPVFSATSSGVSSAFEGSASVCNASGSLLFYCDGEKVYDNTHSVMPNGSGILGDYSTTQGVAIAKVRGDDSLYFLFTLTSYYTGILRYSIVNMKLNSGLGDVVTTSKNIAIDSGFSEKMIIAGSCGMQWLVLHHKDSATFYAYGLGVGARIESPILSTFSRITALSSSPFIAGEMKVSKDFTKIALVTSPHRSYGVILYDFDNATGTVSNRQFIDSASDGYGIEFSEDGSKLYCALTSTIGRGLYQYDLSAGSLAAIKLSKTLIVSSLIFGLRRGPDGMIYFKNYYPVSGVANNFDRIRFPNLSGTACNYQADFLSPPVGYYFWCYGLGNQFQLLLPPKDTIFNTVNFELCKGETKGFSPTGKTGVLWSDGDTAKIKRLKSTPHTYWVESYNDCDYFIDTFKITEKLPKLTYSRRDTSLCDSIVFTMKGRIGSDSVKWYDGTSGLTKTVVGSAGKYWSISYVDCEISVDTLSILPYYSDTVQSYELLNICTDQTIEVKGKSSASSYLWSTGAHSEKVTLFGKGKYWVRSNLDCKLYVDTFEIEVMEYNSQNVKTDTLVCFQDSIKLSAPNVYTSFLWSNGSGQKDTFVRNDCSVSVRAVDTKNCLILNKEYDVQFVNFLNNLKDTTSCGVEPIILDASVNVSNAKYRWSNLDTIPKISVDKSGFYSVLVTALGCSQNQYVNVVFKKMEVNIGDDQSICEEKELILTSDLQNVEYLWSTGETSSSIKVNKTGTYSLLVSKDGCSGSANAFISFVSCTNCVAFPNTFSPNGDGINDFFKPLLNCPTKAYEFKIYNRWGQEIFLSQSPNDRWDGRSASREMDQGVYFYMLKVNFLGQGDELQFFKGDITLVR